jgi:branched-chain amino acid transport system ATP-binding protein
MTLCQNITVIDFGREIAQGNPDEIRNNPDVIKAYLGDGTI